MLVNPNVKKTMSKTAKTPKGILKNNTIPNSVRFNTTPENFMYCKDRGDGMTGKIDG